jgi:disulfide bond formation protein DsbB
MKALARPLAALDYTFQIALLAVMTAILTAALIIQFWMGELPCPLCLLERVAMFGICFGILLNFGTGFSDRNTGLSLTFALVLLVIATRQSLLDIYPRPGHAYIGSAIFGLHMPVWSIVIALAVLFAFALKLVVLAGDDHREAHPPETFPALVQMARWIGAAVIVICAINLVSVALQCGLGECHTTGYALLGGVPAEAPPAAAPPPATGTAPSP